MLFVVAVAVGRTVAGRRFCRALTKEEAGGASAPEFPSNMAANLLLFPTSRSFKASICQRRRTGVVMMVWVGLGPLVFPRQYCHRHLDSWKITANYQSALVVVTIPALVIAHYHYHCCCWTMVTWYQKVSVPCWE